MLSATVASDGMADVIWLSAGTPVAEMVKRLGFTSALALTEGEGDEAPAAAAEEEVTADGVGGCCCRARRSCRCRRTFENLPSMASMCVVVDG